jgi:predicted MPP superfamily phosphohydrolase
MKILHLTDFHFDGTKKYKENEQRLIDSLLDSLSKFKNGIDIVLFTGDLVWKGDKLDDFFKIKEIFLDKICETLNIEPTSIFICPGNHDVYRGQELDVLTKSILETSSNDDLDNLVTKNGGKTLRASLDNLENYYEFQNDFYKEHIKKFKDVEVDNLYSNHIRIIDGKKVGITTINSAWRANDSEKDFGNIMYPIFYLKNALREIKECDIKILMLHHPLTDFKYWNQYVLEDIIYKDYDMMFSGHVHNNRDTVHMTSGIGIYHSTSAATLSGGNDSIGYSVIQLDNETFELLITSVIYNKNEELFYLGEPKPGQIPLDLEKQEQNKFRKTIRKRFDGLSKEANKLFLSYKEIIEENDFVNLFTEPIIKFESQSNPKPKNKKRESLDGLIKNRKENQIIFGKDKSGKSAILYKIALNIMHDFNRLKMLPVFIDCNKVINTERKVDIIDLLSDYYEINKRKATELASKYHIKILLDDFKENEILVLQPISNYLQQNENSSVIAVGNETMFTSFTGGLIGDINFTNRYIHDITRTEIRLLADKWPNITSKKRELVIEKIHTVFSQLNIPSNYWTVSLFIWIFEKNIDVNLGNNFQLIELYIDSLLDKHNFILSNKYKIDFDDLKDFLASFAHELVTNYHKESYLIKYSRFIDFIEGYKSDNKKFVISTKELADLLIQKGIIKSIDQEKFTFRLNGVFEYFIGYYMAYDEEFRDTAIRDNHFYLSFKNEFEVCAGIIPQNFDFVDNIFKKTVSIFEDINKDVDTNNLDALLLSKVRTTFNISNDINLVLKETIKDSLKLEEQDTILESLSPSGQRISEVKPKKFYNEISNSSDDLENALYILGRVFRNSKLKRKDEFNNNLFDFILSSTCTFSISLIEEISSQNVDEIDSNITEEELIRLLTQFLPIVAQTFFFDMSIQSNLEIILKEKIEELKKSKTGNELKLIILYFSLVDLDIKEHSHYIDEIIDIINIPILKQTTLFKLYIYLSFKCNGNKALREKIEKLIKRQELKIDSSQNVGFIEKRIKAIEKSANNK